MALAFEQTGCSRINISSGALDSVETELTTQGVPVEEFSLGSIVAGYQAYLQLPAYAGEYRVYGGADTHCLLEKSLEHYLSLVLAEPRPGQVAVDIGSCKSVVPGILQEIYQVRCYEQDLVYPAGINGDRIGSNADSIPLPAASVDFMMLHCTFEHFEGDADTGFVHECARLLKPDGKTIILPLYLNANFCNVTGEIDPVLRGGIGFDPDAQFHCVIQEWENRFGRHYSPAALDARILAPARKAGLHPRLLRCKAWDRIDVRLWLRWILILEKAG